MTDDQRPDWDRIVELHAKRVFRVAYRILGSIQDAEDTSQDVFEEAFRLHRTGPIQSWTGLLVRLATLRSIDRLRKRRRHLEVRESDRVTAIEPFDQMAADELAQWLRSAMTELPDQQAAVFVMFHFEQLSRDEISAALGASPDAVSTALYKARQRLVTQLTLFQSRGAK